MKNLASLAAAMLCSVWAQTPDTILVNGKVLTVDARNSVQQAVAIREGKIAAVGTTAALRATA
ncbi:MAG: amidohydrolase, partial [Acidobacteriota bacterium]